MPDLHRGTRDRVVKAVIYHRRSAWVPQNESTILRTICIEYNSRRVSRVRARERDKARRQRTPRTGHLDLDAGWVDLRAGVLPGAVEGDAEGENSW